MENTEKIKEIGRNCKQCCGSESPWIRNFCLDLDPELLLRIRSQQNMKEQINPVLWIQICMDPELLPGSGSGIKVPDPDPAKSERAYK